MLLIFTLLLTGLAAVSSYTCIDLVKMPSSSVRSPALNLTVQCGSNVTTLTWRSNGTDILGGLNLIAIEYTCSNLSSGLNHTVQIEGPNSQYNSHSTIKNLPIDDVNFYCVFRACVEVVLFSDEYYWNEDSVSCSYKDVHEHSEDIYDMPQDEGEILLSSVGFVAATPTLVDISTSTTSEMNKSTSDITYTSSSVIQRVSVLETNTEIDNLLSSSKTTSIATTTFAGFEATAISTGVTSELTSSVIQRVTGLDTSTESGAKATADGLSSDIVFVIVGLLVAVIGGVMLLILMTVCFSYRRWLRKTTSIQFKYQIEQKFQEEPIRSVSFYNIESNNPSGSNVTIVHSLSIKQSLTYKKTANDNVAKPTPNDSSATNSCVAVDVPMNEHEGSTSCSTPSKHFSAATPAAVIDNDYKKTVSNSDGYTQEVGIISNDIKTEKNHIPLSEPPSHAKQDSVFDGYLAGEPIDSVKTTHHPSSSESHVRQDSVFDGYLGGEPTDSVRTTILNRQYQSYPSSSAESAYVSGASSSSMSTNTGYLASDFTDSSSNHQLEGTILEKSSPMLCEEPYSSCTISNNTINIMSGYLDNHPQSTTVPAAANESPHITGNQLALPTNADYIGHETEMVHDVNEVNRGDQVAIDVCEMMDYQYTDNSPYLSSSSEIPLPTADDYLVSFKKKPTTINSDVVAFKMASTISHTLPSSTSEPLLHHKQAQEDQLNNTSTIDFDICELDNDPAPATSNYIDSSFPARFSSTSAATPTSHSSYITATIELEVDNDPKTSTLNYTKPLLVPANCNSNVTPTHQLSYNSIQSIDQLSVSSTATERTVIASNVDDGYIS